MAPVVTAANEGLEVFGEVIADFTRGLVLNPVARILAGRAAAEEFERRVIIISHAVVGLGLEQTETAIQFRIA